MFRMSLEVLEEGRLVKAVVNKLREDGLLGRLGGFEAEYDIVK